MHVDSTGKGAHLGSTLTGFKDFFSETLTKRGVEVKRHGIEVRTVLAVLSSREDRASLRQMLAGSEWDVGFALTFQEAQTALRSRSVGVVISEGRLSGGYCWKDLLNEIQAMRIPSQLIVADRLADEALWAEVLNLGCYDLLMTPFAEAEVLRVVPMAWEFRKREAERTMACAKPPARATKAAHVPAAKALTSGAA